MSCTIEKIIADARMLVNRLKDHDSAADSVIGQATVLHKRVEAMKIVRRLLFSKDIQNLSSTKRHLLVHLSAALYGNFSFPVAFSREKSETVSTLYSGYGTASSRLQRTVFFSLVVSGIQWDYDIHKILKKNIFWTNVFVFQYQEDLNELNEIARHRPRSALIMNLAQENSQIRELQQENKVNRSGKLFAEFYINKISQPG